MSDDSDDPAKHEDRINILYFDAHWEGNCRLDPRNADRGDDLDVQKPLDMLRN